MPASEQLPVLYSERLEWEDVDPISQYETVAPVAPIFYTDVYKDATSYFRAVVQRKEYSQRVLDLTLHIIQMNPAHYTVWQYRWETLIALKAALQKEQILMEDIATKFLKTYQVWHHRRLLLTHLKNPLLELLFVTNALQVDTKNYHTWAYRQWILSHFWEQLNEATWNAEIDFAEEMIDADVRNNSAWHHRFFIVWQSGIRKDEENREEVLRRELRYVKTKIAVAPSNLSAWNYLRGILDHTKTPYITLLDFVEPFTALEFKPLKSDEIDLDNPGPSPGSELPCTYALELLADALARESDAEDGRAQKAIELYTSLAKEHDKTRKSYWTYRISQLSQLNHLQAQDITA